MTLKLSKLVVNFLEANPEKRYTGKAIATWITEHYPDECHAKQQRSTATKRPVDTTEGLIAQLAAEIVSQNSRIQKLHPSIKITEEKPKQYYFSNQSDADEVIAAETQPSAKTQALGFNSNEYSLYPRLAEFIRTEFGIYSKRIDERKSSNSAGYGANKWLHPDLVGISDLSEDWHDEIKACVQLAADKVAKLWSFEVKVLINRANVREAFFQAVSNSSWAHLGYLVTHQIQGANTKAELKILSSLHGIGFIQLNIKKPSNSQILIQARERETVDWATANRLAEENVDFLTYIKLVKQFYQTRELHNEPAWLVTD